MLNHLLIALGKTLITVSKISNLGSGSTWPGHIALKVNKNFVKDLTTKDSRLKTIFVAGTNGKTTTSKLIETILKADGKRVFVNDAGANLLNGIASSLIAHATSTGKLPYDYAIFEIDENTLPLALAQVEPDYLLLLNLFRDQLDRYGEVNTIVLKWQEAIAHIPEHTTLVLNANDPQIAFLGFSLSSRAKARDPQKISHYIRNDNKRVFYFGLNDKTLAIKDDEHAKDSLYCPQCSTKLTYKTMYYSHLGNWHCPSCGYHEPPHDLSSSTVYPLPGTYNKYNTLAAFLLAQINNINYQTIERSLKNFIPAFGRQETLSIDGKIVKIFLSKNPTGFNESLRTIAQLGGKHLLLVLNDRIPDGRDVSWIWDIDFESLLTIDTIHVSGDRAYDMAIRLKYAHPKVKHVDTHPRIDLLLPDLLKMLPKEEPLYILPTYSAMLEVRKVLTGRKIL